MNHFSEQVIYKYIHKPTILRHLLTIFSREHAYYIQAPSSARVLH